MGIVVSLIATAKLIDFKLSELKELHQFLEGAVAAEIRDLDQRYHAFVRKVGPSQDWDFDPFEDDYWKLSEAFPQSARKAIFISAYSLFESGLKHLCHHAYLAKLSASPPGHRNFYIENAYEYMTGEVRIPKKVFGTRWNYLDRYRLLRNAIVHQQGKLHKRATNPTDKRLKWFIGRERTVSTDHLRRVKLNKMFCPRYIDLQQKFFSNLLDAMRSRKAR